jgi:[acyl-carrier-protein] S-malonyltransferase
MSPVRGPAAPQAPPVVIHLFPGQGDFSVTPLVRAVRDHPLVRSAVAEVFAPIDEVSGEYGIPELGPALLSGSPPSGRDLAAAATGTAQVAMFGASLAAHRALCAVGAAPHRMLAVSFGEIAALTAAGAFGIAGGTHITCRLARVLAGCHGALTLLAASEAAAERLVTAAGARRVAVACVNSPGETVVCGPVRDLHRVERHAAERGIAATRLRLPFMAHHPSLTRQAEEFRAAIGTVPARQAHTPVHSAVHGGPYAKGCDVRRGMADCLVRPARLPDVLAAAAAPPPALLLETGTGQALTRSARRTLAGRPGTAALSTLADPGFPWERPRELRAACRDTAGGPREPVTEGATT